MSDTPIAVLQKAADLDLKLGFKPPDTLTMEAAKRWPRAFAQILPDYKPRLLALLRLPFCMVFSQILGETRLNGTESPGSEFCPVNPAYLASPQVPGRSRSTMMAGTILGKAAFKLTSSPPLGCMYRGCQASLKYLTPGAHYCFLALLA